MKTAAGACAALLVACGSDVRPEPPDTGAGALQSPSVSGVLHTSAGDVDLTGLHVEVFVSYKQDVDPGEAGCVGGVTVDVNYSVVVANTQTPLPGCGLRLVFSRLPDGPAGLRDIRFRADSRCPGFWDAVEGEYARIAGAGWSPPVYGGHAPRWPDGPLAVDPSAAAAGRVDLPVTLRFPGMAYTLATWSGQLLRVDLGDVVVTGNVGAIGFGDTWYVCDPVLPGCGDGFHDGGDGWCTPRGTCSPAHVLDANGACGPLALVAG